MGNHTNLSKIRKGTINRILSLCGIIVLTTFSCEKNQEYDPFSIIGKWDWIGTIGDPGPNYPTEDFQQMEEFTKDSIHRHFKNGELIYEQKFRTFNDNQIGYEENNFEDPDNYVINNDSLVISMSLVYITFYFKRSK